MTRRRHRRAGSPREAVRSTPNAAADRLLWLRARRRAFAREMAAMAADPQVRAVNREIFRDMEPLDGECLPPP